MPFLAGPVDHAHWQMATKGKKFFISPAIFTQAPALRLTSSSSLATPEDAARNALTADNTFRPVIVHQPGQKLPPQQCPSSPPAPPQGALGQHCAACTPQGRSAAPQAARPLPPGPS